MKDKFKYELVSTKKKIMEIKATNLTGEIVYHIGIGTYPIEFSGGNLIGANWRKVKKGFLYIIYQHTNKLEMKSADEIYNNIQATAVTEPDVKRILHLLDYLKLQKEIPEEYQMYEYANQLTSDHSFSVNDLLSTDVSKINRGRGHGERLYPNYTYANSLIHEVAGDFEKGTGYEVTVIGGAVIDTVCNLIPNEINLYITKPYDYTNDRTYLSEPIDGGYNTTVKELSEKGLFTFEDNYTYYNNYQTNTVAKGYFKTEAAIIHVFIGQETANDFVDAVSPMNIGLLTYTVKKGLYVPNTGIEKAVENRIISYHSKRFAVNNDFNDHEPLYHYYLDPTEERLQEIANAIVRYGFKVNPIKVRLQDILKNSPFRGVNFVDCINSPKEVMSTLFLEVPLYKKTVLDAMSFLLIDLGYEFHELQEMSLTLYDRHSGFEVRTGVNNQIQVVHTYESCIIQGEQVEVVRNALKYEYS